MKLLNQVLVSESFDLIDHHFSLALFPSQEKIDITMSMSTQIFSTHNLPQTSKMLSKMLPSIFESTCFNDNDYAFVQEVENTEIGHLFEHILLEYLCMEKLNNGSSLALFNGVTNWNWKEEPLGTFHIVVDIGWSEREIILTALEKSVKLMNLILSSQILPTLTYDQIANLDF